ncbi:SGNH/GDSL hydrolase family protein, partial [Actinomadura sp. 21ATH]|uniref:SGNH/GDSL hydrolase family protein n=1 Tax=Actinomadura sp. 21ATH TaxID=1735444 RepID=UPI0035C08759
MKRSLSLADPHTTSRNDSRAGIGFSQAAKTAALGPILLLQARRTARRTPRLDPATGADRGAVTGRGPHLRVLVIGESTAVGVGASWHAEALPGFLARALRERLRRTVAWTVTGRNGATARRVTRDVVPSLTPALNGETPDVVVVTVGINDLIRRRPLESWHADLSELVAALRRRYRRAELLVAGMPPVDRFPVLPQPLRGVMAARARAMDRVMREVARANGAIHVPMDPAMAGDRALFAADGLHPSPDGYRI